MIKPDLTKLLARWQDLLKLRDWSVDIAYVPGLLSPGGNRVYGLCSPHVDAKTARIELLDPATPWGSDDPTVESVLVHELLHLHFAPLAGASRAEIVAEEQAVWAIEEAIAKVSSDGARMVARAMAAHAAGGGKHVALRCQEANGNMDPELIKAALEAIVAGDGDKAIEILKGLITGAAGGDVQTDDPAVDPAAAEVDPNKPPMAAAADDPQPDPKAAAADDPKPPPAARAAAPAAARAAVADPLVARFDAFERTQLLEKSGHRLEPSVRAWAATQPLAIVQGLIAASPEKTAPARTATPTRGQGQGATGARLPAAQEAELHRAMGIRPAVAPTSHVDQYGRLVRPAETPTQCRERLARAQKAKV